MARYVEYHKEMAYRIFVTDALYEDENHMRIVPQMRYAERINPQILANKQRSGDEIANEVMKKGGLMQE